MNRFPAPSSLGLLAVLSMTLPACSLFGGKPPSDAVRYDCGFGSRIAVDFDDGGATLWHQGQAFPLQAETVASGMAYGDGYYLFQGKGDTATLSARDTVLFPECKRIAPGAGVN